MSKLRVLDLFSGIGGFSLGLERTGGFETVQFCEIDPYCQKILRKHWPEVPIHDDIRTLPYHYSELWPDVITAGFPCQDISLAGAQAGIDGERSGLWQQVPRIIRDTEPRYAILENVSALLSGDRGRWFGRVLGDLASIGYDAEWHCIQAADVGAPHIRDRIWILAYPHRDHLRQQPESVRGGSGTAESRDDGAQRAMADAGRQCSRGDTGLETVSAERDKSPIVATVGSREWAVEPDVGRVAHGVPRRVDRLRGLGNAIVPQIATLIGHAILAAEGL